MIAWPCRVCFFRGWFSRSACWRMVWYCLSISPWEPVGLRMILLRKSPNQPSPGQNPRKFSLNSSLFASNLHKFWSRSRFPSRRTPKSDRLLGYRYRARRFVKGQKEFVHWFGPQAALFFLAFPSAAWERGRKEAPLPESEAELPGVGFPGSAWEPEKPPPKTQKALPVQ